MSRKPNILLWDIENAPLLGWAWELFETNILKVERPWHLMSAAWSWYPSKAVRVRALPDYPLYETEPYNDLELCQELWQVLDKADIVIGHNSTAFDVKKTQARFFHHGMPPPSSFQQFDTLRAARRNFKLTSNRLGEIAKEIDAAPKQDAGGIETWLGCLNGDAKAWSRMKRYNRQDVVTLREVYEAVRPWGAPAEPNLGNYVDEEDPICPKCAHKPLQRNGFYRSSVNSYHRFRCPSCGASSRGRTLAKPQVQVR